MAGANFIATVLNPNKMPAFNYTALKYFSPLIATGENKINLIFETDSHRESPRLALQLPLSAALRGGGADSVFGFPGFHRPPSPTACTASLVWETIERWKSFGVELDPLQEAACSFLLRIKSDF